MKNYNIFKLSIDNGLKSLQVGTAGDYILLLSAPALANVSIQLNENTADKIPLKAYHAINAKDTDTIFVSADAVAGETITLAQAPTSGDFQMITPASDVNIGTVTKILDKFRPDGTAIQYKILAGDFYVFTKTNETMIRFYASDEVGVELNDSAVKYPMFEEELFVDNLDTITFHNDNIDIDVDLTIWSM
jgi:hypothetical protein